MLFIMLTGCPPVEVATMIDRRFQMIAEDRLGDMIRQWGIVDLSPEAIDLVQRILRPNPNDRLNLIQIQNHPWMFAG
jgi:serine/threonine protein kinase